MLNVNKGQPLRVDLTAAGAAHLKPTPQESASPRHGRPIRKGTQLKDLMHIETKPGDELVNFNQLAFGVPETPPKTTKKYFAQIDDEPASPPFPLANDESARHEICVDSLAPWTYLMDFKGKNTRDHLIDSFNYWLHCKPDHLAIIKQVVGYLHTASLIIDDIEDESETRRGAPAAHTKFGIAPALNAGNYVYFLALEKLLGLQSTECVQVFTGEMLNLHRGQGRDIFWRTTCYIASEEEYRQMVCDKTGGLFRLAIRIMQALSTSAEERMLKKLSTMSMSEISISSSTNSRNRLRSTSSFIYTQTSDFTVLSDQLACFFQIRDDLINLASPKFHKTKGFCEDITEGKFSFIALHCLRALRDSKCQEEMKELLSLLQSKTTDRKEIKKALLIMESTGSFDYTLKYLRKLLVQMKESIDLIGENKMLVTLIDKLATDLDDCYDIRKRVIEA